MSFSFHTPLSFMRYILNAIRWEGKRAITFLVMVSKPGYRPVLHGVVCLLTSIIKQKRALSLIMCSGGAHQRQHKNHAYTFY
ncbi:hypothetical protein ALT1644_40187 [Alteromonas macleodii]